MHFTVARILRFEGLPKYRGLSFSGFTRDSKGEWRVTSIDYGGVRIKSAKIDHKEQATKIVKLVQDAGHEVLNGAALSMPSVICVGKKASGKVKLACQWYKASIVTRLKAI